MMIPYSRTIVLPIDEKEYNQLIMNRLNFRNYLNELIIQYPELFPPTILGGFDFIGWSKSKEKIKVGRRIIRLKIPYRHPQDYLIHPCFILPYLRGDTQEVSKGLSLRKYNTPYHAIASSIGRNAMYWYRMEMSLARNNIIGTTVKSLDRMPKHLLVDEHHTRLKGQKIYVCTSVGKDCFLNAHISQSISYEDFKASYGIFKNELFELCPTYYPLTINTDNFPSTKKAIRSLFPSTTLILCFLHSYLKIETAATKAYADYFQPLSEKVWACYFAENKRSFAQKIRRLEEWTTDFLPDSLLKIAVLKLCQKKRIYQTLRL